MSINVDRIGSWFIKPNDIYLYGCTIIYSTNLLMFGLFLVCTFTNVKKILSGTSIASISFPRQTTSGLGDLPLILGEVEERKVGERWGWEWLELKEPATSVWHGWMGFLWVNRTSWKVARLEPCYWYKHKKADDQDPGSKSLRSGGDWGRIGGTTWRPYTWSLRSIWTPTMQKPSMIVLMYNNICPPPFQLLLLSLKIGKGKNRNDMMGKKERAGYASSHGPTWARRKGVCNWVRA